MWNSFSSLVPQIRDKVSFVPPPPVLNIWETRPTHRAQGQTYGDIFCAVAQQSPNIWSRSACRLPRWLLCTCTDRTPCYVDLAQHVTLCWVYVAHQNFYALCVRWESRTAFFSPPPQKRRRRGELNNLVLDGDARRRRGTKATKDAQEVACSNII